MLSTTARRRECFCRFLQGGMEGGRRGAKRRWSGGRLGGEKREPNEREYVVPP
jgi:hypothetical protein